MAVGSRKDVAGDLDAALPRAVARTHGRLTVEPALSATPDTLPVLIATCRRTAGPASAAVSPGSDDLADRAARLGPAL
nr:hypothetical protein [Mycolicibacterium baixiangningiae]